MIDTITLILIGLILLVQIVTSVYKNKYKQGLKSEYATITDATHSDQYLEYYKQMQLVDIYRVLGTILLVMIMIRRADSAIFQVFAIAVGAIILVFQSLILSFVIYLMLVGNYKVGETVKIGTLGEGEIIYIKPLYFGLAGRNKAGEHTGEFFLIPNNKVWENPIIKVDYSSNAYQKIICHVYYDPSKTSIGFDEYLVALTQYLDKLLPLRNAQGVGHYKSYIGHRYKMDYDLESSQIVDITIGFVSRQSKANMLKRQIYEYMLKLHIGE